MVVIPLDMPRGAIREYIILSKIAAIYIATPPAGEPVMIGVSRDLARAQRNARRRWHFSVDISAALWVRDAATAHRIADTVGKAALRRYGSDDADHLRIRGERAREIIAEVAKEASVLLTEHGAMMARVTRATQEIANELDKAQSEGRLHWFNAAYKRWRMTGQSHMTYSSARLRLRQVMTKRIIKGDTNVLADNEIIASIFPMSKAQ